MDTAVEWLALLLHTKEILSLTFSLESDSNEVFHGISQLLFANSS
jgi:hypothetical protein